MGIIFIFIFIGTAKLKMKRLLQVESLKKNTRLLVYIAPVSKYRQNSS